MGARKRWKKRQILKRTTDDTWFGVVVDHKNTLNTSYYGLLRSDKYGNNRGTLYWVAPKYLEPALTRYGNPRWAKGPIMYQYMWNVKRPDRGCECHCCGHERQR